jgi:hypothetical protein
MIKDYWTFATTAATTIMKRDNAKAFDDLSCLFLETQSVFKRHKTSYSNSHIHRNWIEEVDSDEDVQEMEVLMRHFNLTLKSYENNVPQFVTDMEVIYKESLKHPNLFVTDREFWEFVYRLINRSNYPLLTYDAPCFACFKTFDKECGGHEPQVDPVIKCHFCSGDCQQRFYSMFNM